MTPTEKLPMVCYGILSGIAIYYIRKCSYLEKQNEIQADTIDTLREYVSQKADEEISRMKFWEE